MAQKYKIPVTLGVKIDSGAAATYDVATVGPFLVNTVDAKPSVIKKLIFNIETSVTSKRTRVIIPGNKSDAVKQIRELSNIVGARGVMSWWKLWRAEKIILVVRDFASILESDKSLLMDIQQLAMRGIDVGIYFIAIGTHGTKRIAPAVRALFPTQITFDKNKSGVMTLDGVGGYNHHISI